MKGLKKTITADKWETYQDAYCIAVKDKSGHVVCQLGDCNGRLYDMPDVAIANARLIAAAPELLDALKAFCMDHTNPCGCENCRIIRKAEGRA